MGFRFSYSLILILSFILSDRLSSQTNDVYYNWQLSCTARKDKFDFVLPKVMRRHKMDMWIIIDKGRSAEPLNQDFGPATSYGSGIIIFSDIGKDRIERAVLGGEGGMIDECGAFDIFASPDDLKNFVAKRNPKTIGVNYSTEKKLIPMEGRHAVDGLSHTDYINLIKELGEPYASRLVSAELLISDFRSERVIGEIIEFSKVANTTIRLLERALSNEVISVGKTTQIDIGWWLEDKREKFNFERGWQPTVFLSPPDGIEIANSVRVIQPGDVMQIDWGIGKNNYFTDLKRVAYVLKNDETELPDWIKKSFNNSVNVRNIIKKNVKPGKTGEQILEDLRKLISKAGYVYTELERPSKVDGVEVNIGMHSAGNLGHDQGGSIFAIYPTRKKYIVQPNSIISVEFIVFTPVDEWNGNKVPICVEENALITESGIQWLHPPQNKVLIIR
jgi:Xaa-Pro aminopeptidase